MGFGAVPQGVTRRLYCLSSLSVQLGLTNRLALKNPISAMIGCERFQLIPVSGPIFHFLDVAEDCRPTWQICTVGFLLSGMPLAGDDELGGCQFLQAARASGMKLVSADTNLGSQSKFPTIIKASACVNHDGGGIDLLRELPRRRQAGGDNRIGVVRTVLIDMGDRFFDRINRSDTDAGSQVLPIPVVFGGGGCMGEDSADLRVAAYLDRERLQRVCQYRQKSWKHGSVDHQGFAGVADTHPLALGIDDQVNCHLEVGRRVDVDMAVPIEVL